MKSMTATLLITVLVSIVFTTTDRSVATNAQAPDEDRQFVYGAKVFSGQDYEAKMYPPTVDTLYLLADVTNIISPRYTHVYFWPTTQEYKADWDRLNETINGTLEILQGGRMLRALAQTEYVIQYPEGPDVGLVFLYTGQEAEAQYRGFERQKQAFRDTVAAYREATLTYRQKVTENAAEGSLNQEPPLPPEEPAPFRFLSTGLHHGFSLKLPTGSYTIRFRTEEGQIVPGSEKALVVFSPRQTGIGYTIVPQDRWTTPKQSNEPGQVIYARSGSVIYLQPFAQKEYNELFNARLDAPQRSTGSRDRWTWRPLQSQNEGYLQLLRGGQVVERLERQAYVVKQNPGSTLGYEILGADEAQSSRPADFEGYEIRVLPAQPSFSIRLVDVDGNVVPGSEREIRLLDQEHAMVHFLLPLLPLIVGVSIAGWRHRKSVLFSLSPDLLVDTHWVRLS
jgi:hypothetical protein